MSNLQNGNSISSEWYIKGLKVFKLMCLLSPKKKKNYDQNT